MKTWGLALGAGGIYGFAHVGVIEVLESHGLRPGFIAGTSAGAMVASLWASSKTRGHFDAAVHELLIDHERALQTMATVIGAGNSLTGPASAMTISGLLNGNWLESTINRLTGGKRLSDVIIPLSIVSCDLVAGDIVVFTNTCQRKETVLNSERRYITNASLSTAVRASSSLPGVFAPKTLGSMQLVDGGVKEMVPAYEVKRMGAMEVLAVDLGSYIDRPQHVKGIFSILTRSFNLASRGTTIEHLKEHASLTLQPEVWDIGFPTPAEFRRLIESGRSCANRNIGRWFELIS